MPCQPGPTRAISCQFGPISAILEPLIADMNGDKSVAPLSANRSRHWSDEQEVENVSVEFLYKPHSLTALLLAASLLVAVAFLFDSESHSLLQNTRVAVAVGLVVFLLIGLMVFPAGPFIRPHPLLWRLVFGVAVAYEMLLVLLLFQSRSDARRLLKLFDQSLGDHPEVMRDYAVDCDLTWRNVSDNIFDRFFVSHFIGWVVKAVMLRNLVMCWLISLSWELIEIGFTHMLPNFAECWWDQILLDVVITNGLGIYLGHKLSQYLEMRMADWRTPDPIWPGLDEQKYTWGKLDDFPTIWGKIGRTIMQFTPERWTKVEWGVFASVKRWALFHALVIAFHVEEANAFFLKTVLWIPTAHFLNPCRLILWAFFGPPALRQVYFYNIDPSCKRLGSQAWLCILLLVTEVCVIAKFSFWPDAMFTQTMPDRAKHILYAFAAAYLVFSCLLLLKIRSDQQSKKRTQKGKKND